MPHIELDPPYETYVKRLLDSGLYKTYAEVIKDALRLHMDTDTNAKRMAAIHAAIGDGEADVQAGRTTRYTSGLVDEITNELLQTDG